MAWGSKGFICSYNAHAVKNRHGAGLRNDGNHRSGDSLPLCGLDLFFTDAGGFSPYVVGTPGLHSFSFIISEKSSSCSPRSAAAAKSLQSCPTLCNPIDGSPPGSPIPGILQTRTLEWVAISFSSAWKWNRKVKSLSRVWLFMTLWTAAHQAPPSMGFSRQEHWSGVPLPSPFPDLVSSLMLEVYWPNYSNFLYSWVLTDKDNLD